MHINEKINQLSEEETIRFKKEFLDAMESPKDYPEIYCHGINKISPDPIKVKEILFEQMYGK